MIDKLVRLLDRWLKTTPKDTYLKLLEQFDDPNKNSMTNLPVMLNEFWTRLNPGHFVVGPTPREMMYIDIETRHSDLMNLGVLITVATNALIHEDDKVVMDLSTNEFMVIKKQSLDDYFTGPSGVSVSYHDGVVQLKKAMAYHYQYLENAPSNHHCRVMNRMYNDILTVTRLIVKNMSEAK